MGVVQFLARRESGTKNSETTVSQHSVGTHECQDCAPLPASELKRRGKGFTPVSRREYYGSLRKMRTKDEMNALRSWLLENGWTTRAAESPLDTRAKVWTKVLPGAQCSARENGGAPVEVRINDKSSVMNTKVSIRAQKSDGVWVDFTYYDIPGGDLVGQVEGQVASLVRAWNVAAGQTMSVPS